MNITDNQMHWCKRSVFTVAIIKQLVYTTKMESNQTTKKRFLSLDKELERFAQELKGMTDFQVDSRTKNLFRRLNTTDMQLKYRPSKDYPLAYKDQDRAGKLLSANRNKRMLEIAQAELALRRAAKIERKQQEKQKIDK